MTAAEQPVEQVVGVRKELLGQARVGLATSVGLLIPLLAFHADWKTLGVLAAVELVGGTYVLIRAILSFRDGLEIAEPLPNEAVETTRRQRRTHMEPKQALLAALFLIVWINGLVVLALTESHWLVRLSAVVLAGAIAQSVVQPLVEAYLVSRWERMHGHSRLFRAVDAAAEDEEAELYFADRPVPAA